MNKKYIYRKKVWIMAKNIKNDIFHGKLLQTIWKCENIPFLFDFMREPCVSEAVSETVSSDIEKWRFPPRVTFTSTGHSIYICTHICIYILYIYIYIYIYTYRENVDWIASAIGRRMIGLFDVAWFFFEKRDREPLPAGTAETFLHQKKNQFRQTSMPIFDV